jgi:hypothetical protein
LAIEQGTPWVRRLQRLGFRRIQSGHEHIKISARSIGRLIGGPPLGLDVAMSRHAGIVPVKKWVFDL